MGSNNLDEFARCVKETTANGITRIKCKLGLWSVDSSDRDFVYLEAFHYWKQYKSDGEYSEIIGGKSVTDTLRESFKR